MMAFPSMLLTAASKAGIKIPKLGKDERFNKEKFPYFFIFCQVQLCRPVRWGEHWENAKVIAKIKKKDLKTVTVEQLIAKGLEIH